jgi:hypothetical protein
VGTSGLECGVSLSYETGGAVMSTPFVVDAGVDGSMAKLETAVTALMDAQPTWFWRGAYLDYLQQTRRLDNWAWLIVSNEDLANATTNWLA